MAKQSSTATSKPNAVHRGRSFLQEVKIETDKVTWPTREDLKASTSVVLLFLLLLAVVIGGMDVFFQAVVLSLLGIF